MKNLTPMLKSMIEGIQKRGGKCDTVVVGSDEAAYQVRSALAELNLDFHVIADNEISSRSITVTSQDALAQFPGGCRN